MATTYAELLRAIAARTPPPRAPHSQPWTREPRQTHWEPPRSLGGRIAAARLSAGMTQAQLARRVPCSRSYLSRLEHDRVTPTLALLRALATVLVVSLGSLLDGEE